VKTNKINPARHETICFLWLYASFEKYYDTYASDASGTSQNNIQDLKTEFSDSSRNNSNTLGFDLSNTFEAKVTDKDSTKVPKKNNAT
jgi:hypothetical protein